MYSRWQHIRSRCNNPSNRAYVNYGGRGIMVCPEWNRDFDAFVDYIETLPRPSLLHNSIDRIDNDGNYEPGNIRWATPMEQQNNRRAYKRRALSGYIGVHKVREKWRAVRYVNGVRIYLGLYDKPDEAAQALKSLVD